MFNTKKALVALSIGGVTALSLSWLIYKEYQIRIPDIKVALSEKRLEKLKAINPVTLNNASFFDVECQNYNVGEHGYYLVSSEGSRNDDFAKWSCGHALKYMDCPNLKVIYKGEHALVETSGASKEDYGLAAIKRCAIATIDNAPTMLIATSDDIVEEVNAANNLKSYEITPSEQPQ